MSDKQPGKSKTTRRDPQTLEATARTPSKKQQMVDLLVSDAGATLAEIEERTGWLKHTARAALTRLKKKGYVVSSDKTDGVRTYRAITPR